jgi:serine/threonine-protein kinase
MPRLVRDAPDGVRGDRPAPDAIDPPSHAAGKPTSSRPADAPTNVGTVAARDTGLTEPPGGEAVGRAGRYELNEQLGIGATATVWRAWDPNEQRHVAVKVLHTHLLADKIARQRLEAEAAWAAKLTHPNIVPIIDSTFSKDEAALVFSFVEGRTLAQRLEQAGGVLSHRESALIAAQIAGALAFIHQAGFIHRDVKPSNILVGADGRARLLDFGISRAIAEAASDLTGTGMAIGTLPYMAPEQLAGQPADPASDVFALGAVLYQMLAGHRPFDATAPLALAIQQQTAPPAIAGAPTPLVELALAALSHDVARRPSAAQFARSARDWMNGRANPDTRTMPAAAVALAAGPPALAGAASPSLRRPSRRVVVAGLLPLGLAVAVTAAFAFGPDLFAPAPAGAPESLQPSPAAQPTQAAPDRSTPDDRAGGGGDNEGAKKDGNGRGNGDNRGRGGGGGDDDDDDD